MRYDFDRIIDRKATGCYKYDTLKLFFGRDDIDSMWVADMDFAIAPEIQQALQKRLDHPIHGYNYRLNSYYEAIIRWMDFRHGWLIEKEWIVNTPGIVPAINLAVLAYTKPGDKIVIQTPVYHPFFNAVTDHERVLLTNQMINTNGEYTIDYDDFEAKIKQAKLFIFCNPHNPMGKVFSEAELIRIGNICLKYNVSVISDEIHSDIIFDDRKHIPFAKIPGLEKISIVCMSPSKSFNLAGLCSSAIIIPDADLRKPFYAWVDKLHLYMGNSFGITAFTAAYSEGEFWQDALNSYLQRSRDLIVDFVSERLPKVVVSYPYGTYLAWLDFRKYDLSDEDLLHDTVHKAGVALDPGTKFGLDGCGFMRLNFGCPVSRVESVLRNLENWLKEYELCKN